MESITPIIHANAIPFDYRKKLNFVIGPGHYQRVWDDPESLISDNSFKLLWGHTRSGELTHFKQGSVQWSTSMSSPVKVIILAECQASEKCSLLCLLVSTENTVFIYDAMIGRLLESWPSAGGDFILSDLRNIGLCSLLIFPENNGQETIPCLIFPRSARPNTSSNMASGQEDVTRAVANMDSTLEALERQLELKRQKIQRLEESLTSKSEIIQGCQDMVDGPLRSVFNTGGVCQTYEDSTPSDVLAIFQKKRLERRKRVLERLIPIVGRTVVTDFTSAVDNDNTVVEGDLLTQPVHILECVSGWIESTSEGIVWFGVHIENQSEQPLFNVHLSVAQHDSCGLNLSRLETRSTGLIVGAIRVNLLELNDDEYLEKSLVTERLMAGMVRLHLDQKLDQKDGPDMYHRSLLMTSISALDYCPKIWRSALAGILLPFNIGCRLDGITYTRLSVLLQDGLSLSSSDEKMSFGSLEESLIVKILPTAQSLATAQHESSWDVTFQGWTEALVLENARKATLLSPRFA
ncbi:hypothetical protein BGX27_003194 [Mortierella sp. AM989]|nr:hypothetical protein BGX27_003194 [Mortierella sp. AM989]